MKKYTIYVSIDNYYKKTISIYADTYRIENSRINFYKEVNTRMKLTSSYPSNSVIIEKIENGKN